MDAKYYVYRHIEKDTGKTFYVGKGCGKRAWQKDRRSLFWKRNVKKHGIIVEIIIDGLSEKDAYMKEIEKISEFKKIGLCKCNFSSGGGGVTVPNRWWGEKISESLKKLDKSKYARGTQNVTYKDFATKDQLLTDYSTMNSVQIAKKYGVSIPTVCNRIKQFGIKMKSPGQKPKKIFCSTNNITYNSISDAANKLNLFRENIRKVLKGIYNHTGGYSFSYSDK